MSGRPQALLKGAFLGYTDTDDGPRPVVYARERSGMVMAPPGSGKFARFMANNFLGDTLAGCSKLAIGVKGEEFLVSALYQLKSGHDVALIDPFGHVPEIAEAQPEKYRELLDRGLLDSVGFNPMNAIDAGPRCFDHSATNANVMISTEKSQDAFWPESAQGLATAAIMHTKRTMGDKANLPAVRYALTAPEVTEVEPGTDGKPREIQTAGLRYEASCMVKDGGPAIASLAARYLKSSKSTDSVLATFDTHTRWMLSDLVGADLMKPGFDFRRLKQRPTACYVVLPIEFLETHAVWLKLLIVNALHSLYRPGGVPTYIFVDEMPALGHLAPLMHAFRLVRGFNTRIIGFAQDLPSLEKAYGDETMSMIAAAGFTLGFAPNDLKTAEFLADMSGQTTVTIHNETLSYSSAHGDSTAPPGQYGGGGLNFNKSLTFGSNTSASTSSRPLYYPTELRGLPEGEALLFLAGLSYPAKVTLPIYAHVDPCAGRALPNPYFNG